MGIARAASSDRPAGVRVRVRSDAARAEADVRYLDRLIASIGRRFAGITENTGSRRVGSAEVPAVSTHITTLNEQSSKMAFAQRLL